MRRGPGGRTTVLRPGIAAFRVSCAALSCLSLKSIDALGWSALSPRSRIRARTTVSVPSNTPEYRSRASHKALARAWAAVSPLPPATRCRLSRSSSTSVAPVVNACVARKFGPTARPAPASSDKSTSALTIPVRGLIWCLSRSKVCSGEATRNPPSTISPRRATSFNDALAFGSCRDAPSSVATGLAPSPQAGHCGRFTRLWRRQSIVTESNAHTAPSSPDRPSTNHLPTAVAARPAAALATPGRSARGTVATSSAARLWRTYSSTRRWPRSRCATHCQQPVSPGVKNGPTHAWTPMGLTSSQERPLAKLSALIWSSALRR